MGTVVKCFRVVAFFLFPSDLLPLSSTLPALVSMLQGEMFLLFLASSYRSVMRPQLQCFWVLSLLTTLTGSSGDGGRRKGDGIFSSCLSQILEAVASSVGRSYRFPAHGTLIFLGI